MSNWAWHPERAEGDRWVELGRDPDPETTLLATAAPADILTAGGIQRAPEVIELAAAVGLDLAAAAVMLEKESGGGHQIWGHDGVSTGGIYVPGSPVTQAAYLAYKAKRSQLGCQGVGASQLTFYALQDEADAEGGCWDWRPNVTVGFRTLAGLIKANGLQSGFRHFNGSGPAAEAYAADAMAKYDTWRVRLGTPDPAGGNVADQQIDEMHVQLTGVLNAWDGGVTDANATKYNLWQFVLRNNVEIHQVALMAQQLLKRAQAKPPGMLRSDVNEIAATVAAHPALEALMASANDPLLTASFWAQTGERAFKSVAGSLVSVWGASGALNLFSIPWQSNVGVALGAGVLSVLMSVMSAPVGPLGSPSLVGKPQ